MIARAVTYARPSATVRARFGRLLGPDEYKLLLAAADVISFFSVLRTTSYAAALDLPGRSFGFAIQHDWIARAENVAQLMPGGARELCLAYLAKAEIDALKTLFRGIARAIDRRRLASMLGPLPATISFPLNALLAANSLEEAAQALSRTPYGTVIAPAMKAASGGATGSPTLSVLPLEQALDRWFFVRIMDACRHFSGVERRIVERLIGTLADTANILAVQRLRRTFHFAPDAVDAHLVPLGFRLDQRKRRLLCEWDGEAMPPFWFGGIASRADLRVALMRTLCVEAVKPLFAAPFQAGLAISYLLLTEMETADLVAIYEGKRWAIERGDIAERLIRFSSMRTGLAGV